MSEKDISNFIHDLYLETYEKEFIIECQDKTSQSAKHVARLAAQRKAIDKVLVESLLKYSPGVSESDIWKQIGITHKVNVAELGDFGIEEENQASVIERCLSAHQSWIKSSGHSFERYISNIENELLKKNEIRFILQSELTSMIKNNMLTNTSEDIAGLKSWGKDFDLYAIQSVHGDIHVFGCIQSKTSIRDRVGRDVNFSNNAMEGQVQGWLDGYSGIHVCSRQIWKEAFNHYDGEPKKYETNEICQIMDTQIIGWKRGGYHRFTKEGYGTQRCWIREEKEHVGVVNEPDKDGFIKLTEGEQMELPFD